MSGTYVALAPGDDAFIAAADSRGLDDFDVAHDDLCKVRVLGGGKIIFTQMGQTAPNDPVIASISRGIASHGELAQTAEAWADAEMERHFYDLPPHSRPGFYSHYPDHSVTTGIFAGESNEHRIIGRRVKIIIDNISTPRMRLHKELFPIEPISGQPIQGSGSHLDLYEEFFLKVTPRSKEASRSVDEAATVTEVDRLALRARALVQFMIDYANDPAIGGVPHVAILERGKDARWLPNRPSFCAESE